MFACLSSLSMPLPALTALAEDFTPRYEVIGTLVMLDISGLTRLFGTPRDLGEQMRRAAGGPVRIAIAPTQTAAACLALGRAGLTVVTAEDVQKMLSPLPVSLLGEHERLRLGAEAGAGPDVGRKIAAGTSEARGVSGAGSLPRVSSPAAASVAPGHQPAPPSVGEMWDALPYFHSTLGRTSDAAAAPFLAGEAHLKVTSAPAPSGGGWSHPRDAHAAAHARRPRREVTAPRDVEHPPAPSASIAAPPGRLKSGPSHPVVPVTPARQRATERAIADLLTTLRRWGVKTFGEFMALPAGDVYERLGARGVTWQRLARGEDLSPLIPWVPDDPFEASLDLEWPIEGLEPLSFVLARLLEPLSERLERADRGVAIVHTHLRLVDKTVHARTLQLPAPMRDPKTLRTLLLLDLESNPPSAGIDRVRVLIEPTPARVIQWALFDRAQPSPEQVSTLLARLTALMGESHVGSPRLVDTWRPGAFEMTPFVMAASNTASAVEPGVPAAAPRSCASALRRFRLPIAARVRVEDGRPVRVMTDRRGVSGGPVLQAAGPWRTSGEWWNDGPAARAWDRDEWDVALADGTVYRLYVEREIGQWFLEGVID